jgi:6-phosphogluconolactonase (cycloisomerase 2 family)
LNSPRGVAISEDGTSVYVASDGDDSIVWLARNLQTGALTPGGCVDDNDTGADGCAVSADGLKAAIAVAVSPDGKSVYVAGQGDDALVLFNRDSQTGALTPAGCIDDNDTGAETCAQTADGLDVPRDVVVSADGGSVYVVSQGDSAISAFGRDTQTGGLTPLGCIDDNDNGLDNCSQSVDGLGNARGVAVSPDGTSVYAAGQDDDALVAFGRDTGTGALTPAGCIDDNDTGSDTCAQSADGLDGIRGVVVSPDGRSVYVVAENDNSVTGFNRDQQSGALTFSQCVDDNDTSPETCSGSTDGLEHVFALSISPDGRSVYAQSEIDNAVVIFDRAGEAAPQTTITSGPKAKTGDRTPSFKFKSSEPGSTFECKLDSSTFASCTSPKTYGKQKFGKHTFQVRATGSNGEDDPTPAKRTWKIVK